ncbi:MAG: class I SAM-dependent methyltransferase [Desulfuromonadales bacterium]|nr:MAG: class I SAM-dependent methyltransferase [Desulfuromonadales bacterium]
MKMGKVRDYFKRKLRRHGHSGHDASVNPCCEELEVNNWMISEFVVYDLVPIVGVHPYPVSELCLMAAAINGLKPTHLFEWGTNLGKSARIFYETARRFGVGTKIYSVDLPDDVDHAEHPRTNRGLYVKSIKDITLLLGDGLETSLAICNDLRAKAECSPLFFIDGDHSYESVRRELDAIVTTVPEANILLHDTFYQSADSGYNVGPYQAVEDVLATVPHRYRRLSQNLGLPGMTLLYRK